MILAAAVSLDAWARRARRMSVVSVLELPVREGAEDDLARAFEELDVFGHRGNPAASSAAACCARSARASRWSSIAEWDTTPNYQGWLDNPVRAS